MELTISTQTPDANGWANVTLTRNGEDALAVGQIRPVEGTEEGPTPWYDVRVFDADGKPYERRFVGWETAVLSAALYAQTPNRDVRRALGWP